MIVSPPNQPQKGLLPWQAALAGTGAGAAFGFFGFTMMRLAESPRMGVAIFYLLPFVVGATIALLTPRPVVAVTIVSTTISLLMCLGVLVAAKAEGLLCAILAFPFTFVSMLLGVALGLLLRALFPPLRSFTGNFIVLLAAPVILFTGHHLEMKSFTQPRTMSITTTIHVPAAPEKVWSNIQSLEKLAGTKPFLMHIGLPIPQRCVLKGTAVGSKRICYFDKGSIEESILEWDPPRHMLLAIDRTNMPGRHWLEFDGARYDLQADANGTTLTRTTTIRSNLRPAWYWAPFERWGVSSEHTYLFSDLATRFPAPAQK